MSLKVRNSVYITHIDRKNIRPLELERLTVPLSGEFTIINSDFIFMSTVQKNNEITHYE